jgi:N-acetylglutamate synthase-like GNAT family acetyltransferase
VRGERIGVLLTANAVHLARDHGACPVHAVTETAAGFFEGLGFERTGARDSLPDPIRGTPMVEDACAETAAAFVWPPAEFLGLAGGEPAATEPGTPAADR